MEITIAIIALVIAVIGWIITYLFSIRAQNENFVNQVKNNARLEIVKSIREYQDWLGKVQVALMSLGYNIVLQESNLQVDWFKTMVELQELFSTQVNLFRWMYLLEEYEILFPKTKEARCFLIEQDGKIGNFLNECLYELRSNIADFDELKRIVERIGKDSNEILANQIALMQDLLVYLQNLCLSSFTHHIIPERKPQDLSLPRLVSDKKGNIKITGKNKIPSQSD
jgi:hypothetical protein